MFRVNQHADNTMAALCDEFSQLSYINVLSLC